ncbi:MAG: hypothetical protein HYX52_05705 [Chloroflexi bacterium]|nr:hypothetical protein [Chloroflexota bacterium]
MAITLADVAKLQKDPLTKGFMDIFLEERDLAQFIPSVSVDSLKTRDVQTTTLPSMSWRDLGDQHAESKGAWDWVEETVYSMGAQIEIDYLLRKDKSLAKDPMQQHVSMFARASAYEFNDVLVNGDPTISRKTPAGISYRLGQAAAELQLDAASLDLSTGASRDANGLAFIDLLDQLIDTLEEKANLLLVNRQVKQVLRSILMRKGLWASNVDQFGRQIGEYRGAKIIDCGRKSDQKTQIIPVTATLSPIYLVRTGGDFFHMKEFLPLTVKDLGRVSGTKVERTDVEWVFGYGNPNPWSIAGLKNIKVA